MSDRSTQLLLAYLDLIDTYQKLRGSLSAQFSAGFFAIAQANYNSTSGSREYGTDFYDERMTALRGIEVIDGTYKSRKLELVAREDEKEDEKEEEVKDENPESDTKRKGDGRPVVDPRDPIRWFGILVPPALRRAQSDFTQSIETTIPQLLTTLSKLSSVASQIESYRSQSSVTHLYKILLSPPPTPLPEAISLSPLDISSGFIHLCTVRQLPRVIARFMTDAEKLWLLKVMYSRIEEDVKWESVAEMGKEEEEFPHLYNRGLGANEVGDIKEINKNGGKGWQEILDGLDWLEE